MSKVLAISIWLMSMVLVSAKADPVRFPDFPDSLGIAGAFMGVSKDVVIVAGGSHFDKPQWNGGTKELLDDIWVLRRETSGGYKWIRHGTLPFRVSNGASVTLPQGLICIGGATDTAESDAVFLLTWDNVWQTIRIKQLPSLPQPCAYLSAIELAGRVMVAGGKNKDYPNGMDNWWMLDLDDASQSSWQCLGQLPSSRFGSVLGCVKEGSERYLLLGSGKSETRYLTDLYCWSFDSHVNTWKRLEEMPRAALAAPTVSTDGSAMWVFGGSDGVNIASRLALRDDYHLNDTILQYDIHTDTWAAVGILPEGIVSTQALRWENGVLLIGGELGNAMRSRKVWLYDELIRRK